MHSNDVCLVGWLTVEPIESIDWTTFTIDLYRSLANHSTSHSCKALDSKINESGSNVTHSTSLPCLNKNITEETVSSSESKPEQRSLIHSIHQRSISLSTLHSKVAFCYSYWIVTAQLFFFFDFILFFSLVKGKTKWGGWEIEIIDFPLFEVSFYNLD